MPMSEFHLFLPPSTYIFCWKMHEHCDVACAIRRKISSLHDGFQYPPEAVLSVVQPPTPVTQGHVADRAERVCS